MKSSCLNVDLSFLVLTATMKKEQLCSIRPSIASVDDETVTCLEVYGFRGQPSCSAARHVKSQKA